MKEKTTAESVAKGQTSLVHFTHAVRAPDSVERPISNAKASLESSLEEDLNLERRKRQKTMSPDRSMSAIITAQTPTVDMDWHQQLQTETLLAVVADEPGADLAFNQSRELVVQDELEEAVPEFLSATLPTTNAPAEAETSDAPLPEAPKTTPKKQIKVSKSGKLISSPPKSALEVSASPKKRRGRKPVKAKVSPTVTIIKYGSTMDIAGRTALGQKIEDILNSKKRSTGRRAAPKKPLAKPVGPLKDTHPFFTSKKEQAPCKPAADQSLPTPRKSAVTPGKLRAEARRDRSPEPMPAFGVNPRSGRASKQSGLNEAPWPTREVCHVRNLDESRKTERWQYQGPILKPRKMKSRVVRLSEEEELVARMARDLRQATNRPEVKPTSEFEPPEDVRLPRRLLTTGIEIQQKVREQVLMQLPMPGTQGQPEGRTHPAITSIYSNIAHSLTPFDEGKCESLAWTLKYSPKGVSHILQTGKEATILKDWLQSLTVMAVGGALKSSALSELKKPPKKKRRKPVDDFVVSDGDEDDEGMLEVLDPNDWAPNQLRSITRPRWTRNNNVILISGPHGCGKSAMVYAVAKELGFEVFEINAGTRRSGKDIQDKVGDMTANHLVNHNHGAAPAKEEITTGDDTDNERMDTALRDDLTSGRQGTMTSFFQAKPAAPPKVKIIDRPQSLERIATSSAQAILPMAQSAQKSQKQSLILFEEADILFEEDQQFWAQVTRLASNSKRPIIITCNDERQIPMYDLPLAAVLRLRPPPVDLAVDYLLVIAAQEGHILERKAIRELYLSKSHDLRASLTELNFWCQMSVGDRKGGLEWMYQRWPPGRDANEQGQLLRVASEGTYHSGMGWFSHNLFESARNGTFDREESLLIDTWADWSISPDDWMTSSSSTYTNIPTAENSNLRNLEQIDDLAEVFSAADVHCRVGLPTYIDHCNEPTDPTLPAIPGKARLSCTLAAPLLQVDQCSDFLDLDTAIFTQTHLLARSAYPVASQQLFTRVNDRVVTEADYARKILQSRESRNEHYTLSRLDFASALDVLAVPPDNIIPERTYYTLTPSSFDRTFSIITLELAPYVRSIVVHEQILESNRLRMSNLLSMGGTAKRSRTTRAARTALEGGIRETKRRDRWFDENLNFSLVLSTAGKDWAGKGAKREGDGDGDGEDGTASLSGTLDGAHDSDVFMRGSQEH